MAAVKAVTIAVAVGERFVGDTHCEATGRNRRGAFDCNRSLAAVDVAEEVADVEDAALNAPAPSDRESDARYMEPSILSRLPNATRFHIT